MMTERNKNEGKTKHINLVEGRPRNIRPDFKTVVSKDCSLLKYSTLYSGRNVLIIRRVFTPPLSQLARYVDEVYSRNL
jgi:hypothetical protein